MERSSARIFQPGRIGGLTLRNRVIKTATYEGMVVDGGPSRSLVRHHVELAEGGVGMTTVAYCAVTGDGRTFADQMHMREAIAPSLGRLVDAVHAAGAAASIQLGHCGTFSKNEELGARRPLGPSGGLNAYGAMSGRPFAAAMSEDDIERTAADFGRAVELAGRAGFDAVELHFGHGYLVSQFLSPATNHRRDRWGGSLENRLRFPRIVLAHARRAVGPGFPILVKTNLSDGIRGGLEVEESIEIARALEADGADALVLSGGFVSRNPFYLLRGGRPLRSMISVETNLLQKVVLAVLGRRVIRAYPFEEMYFLEPARRVRRAVKLPLVLLGGISSFAHLERAMDEGFDFVAMGRALLADPALLARYRSGEASESSCNACNECVAEMDRPGGVVCSRAPAQLEARAREVALGHPTRPA